MASDELETLISLSRLFGADVDLVQGGGGNTSVKLGDGSMLVKASGTTLRDASAVSFVLVDSDKVLQILDAVDLQVLDLQQRDRFVTQRINDTVLGKSGGRPSIETFLHAMLHDKYVVHVHPVLVNALTCIAGGEHIAEAIFPGLEFLWVGYGAPGYSLALKLKEVMAAAEGELPPVIFLENHGVMFSGSSPDEICCLSERVLLALNNYFGDRHLDLPNLPAQASARQISQLQSAFLALGGEGRLVIAASGSELMAAAHADNWEMIVASAPLYPDHVVYCGEAPLVLPGFDDEDDLLSRLNGFVGKFGYLPKVVVDGVAHAVFIAGQSGAEIETIGMMLETHAKVLAYIGLKGSPKHLSAEDSAYIANWESEKFRRALLVAGKEGDL